MFSNDRFSSFRIFLMLFISGKPHWQAAEKVQIERASGRPRSRSCSKPRSALSLSLRLDTPWSLGLVPSPFVLAAQATRSLASETPADFAQ